ncbi:hypothetical protein O166_05715 [Pseudogulbenkiania ferrooxidans EGD-HP2]|uniref:Uncharacterized protein n=1 Tax=Pseudogulbenkiania ferrooxidans EGD-HP2 TaxID=1388764 RepID=A0ABP2XP59_9NEIS|nr:hypothetical protein O166_05715 [Pseudogulbenkiania ferrooxidans EGD-HP2]
MPFSVMWLRAASSAAAALASSLPRLASSSNFCIDGRW